MAIASQLDNPDQADGPQQQLEVVQIEKAKGDQRLYRLERQARDKGQQQAIHHQVRSRLR